MAQLLELHIDTSATSDIQINSACLPPDACPGDLIAVRPVLPPSSKGKAKDSPLLYKIEHPSDESSLAGEGKLGTGGVASARRRTAAAVTVSPTLAAAFGWVQNRIPVQLELISAPPPPAMCASHVELYFNNLYLSRPDAFVLAQALIGKVLHSNQRILLPGSGARLRVGDMWSSQAQTATTSRRRRGSQASRTVNSASSSHNLDSAYLTDSTKLILRTESSRSYIFIEVSQEMWQFEEDGGMLVEKCEMFLEEVFAHYSGKMSKEAEDKRSKGIPTSHVISMILYGRVIYDDPEDAEEERAPLSQTADGTFYRDFFKVILDLAPSPTASVIQTVAAELRRWQELVLLRTRADGTEKLSGRLACAHESPILEATNLALNSFEEHWIDRDLHRTGFEVIVLTAGSSFYQVDKQLLRLTTERMLFHGIGLDMISLSKMPLHSVPLFQFSSPDPAAADSLQAEIWTNQTDAGDAVISQAHGKDTTRPGSHKHDSLFTVHAASSLQSAPSPPVRSSISSRHPQLLHRPSMTSLRDHQDRPYAGSPLRDVHQAPSTRTQAIPSTPQSILKPESIHTSLGVGAIARDVSVPEDQRDPLYYDPAPTLRSHVTATTGPGRPRAPSTSTAPFPASATTNNPLLSTSQSPGLAHDAPPPVPTSLYYAEPLFVFPHFFGTQPDKPHRVDRFMPRARCYELFSQGLGERIPFALPLLRHEPALAAIKTEDDDDQPRGYLDEYEKKVRRRELFDAAALGVDDLEYVGHEEGVAGTGPARGGIVIGKKGNWGIGRDSPMGGRHSPMSGEVSTGTSYGGHGSESASISCEDDDRCGSPSDHSDGANGTGSHRGKRHLHRKQSESEGDENAFGIGMPSVMVAAAKSEARQSRHERTESASTTTSSIDAGEADRGRNPSRNAAGQHIKPLASNDSGSRSKTPVPKYRKAERASSTAASIRTTASTRSRHEGPGMHSLLHSGSNRKASTPALIARLTGGTAPPQPSDSADLPGAASTTALRSPTKPTAAPSRPSWLSLFTRTNSSASTTTITPANVSTLSSTTAPAAPQVAVARVDVQANVQSEPAPSSTAGSIAAGSPVLSATSITDRHSSANRDQIEAEMAVAASDPSHSLPTQPIIIGTKIGLTGSKEQARRDNDVEREKLAKTRDGQQPSGQISGFLKVYEPGEAMRKGLGKGRGRIAVAARFNPSKPGKRSVGLADQARRWAGILVIERKNVRLGVKWRSITRGAQLPITTDYLPSSDELASQYSEYRYSVPTNCVTASFLLRPDHPKRSHILTLVTELICQRLSHGFQIYTPTASRRSTPESTKTLPEVLHDIQNGETTAVYLSLSNQIHRIWYDRRTQSVFVKILRRRRTWAKPEYQYQPLIWTQGADRADVTPLTCPYPSMVDPVEWQHADRLVAGSESYESNHGVRYRSTRLVLLPALKIPDREYIITRTKALQVEEGEVTDAMIQEQGFYTLLDLIENARWSPAGVEKAPISIHQTTLDAPGWAASVAAKPIPEQTTSRTASPALNPSQPPTTRSGWLSRMQSRTGRDESQPPTPMLERDLDLPLSPTPPTISLPDSISLSPKKEAGSSKRPIVQMTHAVVLDLDPARRSERAERVICHLDRSHNVNAAYHIELAWLTASGKTVDTAIQAWARQMARYGITLIEVSTRPVLARDNPFQKPRVIHLFTPPPVSGGHTRTDYLSRVLRSLDFFLDLGADSTFPESLIAQYSYRRSSVFQSQFIHRSGAGIASILAEEDGFGFAYVPNRIFTSHHPMVDENEPFRRLTELCNDSNRLQALWQEDLARD